MLCIYSGQGDGHGGRGGRGGGSNSSNNGRRSFRCGLGNDELELLGHGAAVRRFPLRCPRWTPQQALPTQAPQHALPAPLNSSPLGQAQPKTLSQCSVWSL